MPVFETDNDRTYFLTTIPIHADFMVSLEEDNEHKNDTTNRELTESEQLVLGVIQDNAAITIQRMVEILGISRSTVVRAMKSLQEKRVIERIGSRKKGMWKILK